MEPVENTTAPLSGGDDDLEELVEPAVDNVFPAEAQNTIVKGEKAAYQTTRRIQLAGGFTTSFGVNLGTQEEVVIRSAAGDDGVRLHQQSTLLRSLKSPFLPSIVDLVTNETSVAVIQACASGPLLSEALKEATLPFERVLRILSQVTSSLALMHEAGFVHRGVRPQVIRMGPPVQLTDMDFVLASGTQAPPVYHGGYTAPDVFESSTCDPRSDVYSIGAILYQAATGKLPPETGLELAAVGAGHSIAGLPQLLSRCIGPVEQRYANCRELHAALLQLARRIAPAPCWHVAGATSIGMEPSRTTNQDAFLTLHGGTAGESLFESWCIAAVADGMGGMEGGDLAAKTAVSSVERDAFQMLGGEQPSAEPMSQALARWIANANRQVHQHLSGRGLRGGCTIVCSIARNSSLAVGYVGDCRAYHWNGQSLRLVTRDHSLVMSLVVQGELSEDELRGHADRSQVTRSLGERSTLPDYYVDSLRVVTGEDELRAQPGDLILLCSDGLWEPVSEDAIAATLRDQGTTLVQKSCTLITQSLQEGGPDNATVVLMQYS